MESKFSRGLLWISFVVYMLFVIWIIGFKANLDTIPAMLAHFKPLSIAERVGKDYIPFYSVARSFEEGKYFDYQHLLNVLIYIPMGVYLPYLFTNIKRKYLISFLIITFSSVIFELFQLFTGLGACDGTDWYCNTSGGVVGLILYALLHKRISQKVFNGIVLVFTIILSPVVIFAIVNTIVKFDLYSLM